MSVKTACSVSIARAFNRDGSEMSAEDRSEILMESTGCDEVRMIIRGQTFYVIPIDLINATRKCQP